MISAAAPIRTREAMSRLAVTLTGAHITVPEDTEAECPGLVHAAGQGLDPGPGHRTTGTDTTEEADTGPTSIITITIRIATQEAAALVMCPT